MTRLFNRNKKTTIAELEEYYANQARKKSNPVTPWVMAFLSVAVTVAIIAALFFGGRWLYQTVTDSEDTTTTTTDTTYGEDVDLPTFDSDSTADQGNADADNDTATDSAGVVSDQAASTTTPNNVATTGPSEEIPNTGAGEILLIVPVLTAFVGYGYARRSYRKR